MFMAPGSHHAREQVAAGGVLHDHEDLHTDTRSEVMVMIVVKRLEKKSLAFQ